MGVVVEALVGAVAERIEDDPLRLRLRLDQIDDRLHRDAAPLRDAGPALDAEVLRDLLVVGQRAQLREVELDGILDEAVDPQPVVGEVAVEERVVLVGVGVLAVVPEVRRDVCFAVLARLGIDVLEEVLRGPMSAYPTRCTTRGWRSVNGVAATQPAMTTTIDARKSQSPSQPWSLRPG